MLLVDKTSSGLVPRGTAHSMLTPTFVCIAAHQQGATGLLPRILPTLYRGRHGWRIPTLLGAHDIFPV
jgi:hypothetical protein